MNRVAYIAIMKALGELIVAIMIHAGGVPADSARKIVKAFLQAAIGQS